MTDWRKALPTAVLSLSCVAAFAIGMRLQRLGSVLVYLLLLVLLGLAVSMRKVWRTKLRSESDGGSAVFLVAGAVGLLILPFCLPSSAYTIYVETRAVVLACTVLALCVSLGLAGMVDLGFSAFVGCGAYTAAILSKRTGLTLFATPLVGGATSACLALIIAPLLLKSRGHYFALATLGFGLVIHHLMIHAVPLTEGVDGIRNIPGFFDLPIVSGTTFGVANWRLPYQMLAYYWVLLVMVGISAFVWRLKNSQLGRCLQANRDNETAAAACGVNASTHRTLAYVVSAAIGGVVGSLYAHTVNYIAPADFALDGSIYYLSLAILGATGRIAPCIAVSFAMLFLEEKLRQFGDIRLIILSIAIMGVVVFRARSFFIPSLGGQR